MDEDPLFWQNFYGNASERHANLYYDKAVKSFDPATTEWINRSEVEGEGENLRIAESYFEGRAKEVINSSDIHANDPERVSLVKSLMAKQSLLVQVFTALSKHELTSAAENKLAAIQSISDDMKSAADKLFQDVSQIYDEARRSITGIDDMIERADKMVKSSGKQSPVPEAYKQTREIERFITKYKDPLEFRWNAAQLPTRWQPPEEQTPIGYLVNRREETQLLQALHQSNRIGLYGPIGSGKTNLLLRLWNNVELTEIFSDGGIWIQSPRFSIEDIPSVIAAALGQPLDRSSALIVQATEVFHLLNRKKVLIILDGASSKNEVDTMLKCVPQSCTLLVTSSSIRCLQDLKGEMITVGSLELPEAVSLFRNWYRQPEPNQEVDQDRELEICQELAGLPLAIELVGRYIHQSRSQLKEVCADLKSLQPGHISMGNRALQKALSLCITHLSADTVGFLKKLSEVPVPYFSQDILQAICYPYEKLRVLELLELGLLRCHESDEFYLAPLVPVILHNGVDPDILRSRSGLRILDFLQTYISANMNNYKQLERIRSFLSWVIDHAPKHEFAGKLIELVRLAIPFLMNTGHWFALSRALATGLECSELTDNIAAHNLFSYHIALLDYRNGHLELAGERLQKKADSLRKHEDWPLLLNALYLIGRVFEEKEEFRQASSVYQEALTVPTTELLTQIHIAYHLGKVENMSNNPDAAGRANQVALNAIAQFTLFSRMYHDKDS